MVIHLQTPQTIDDMKMLSLLFLCVDFDWIVYSINSLSNIIAER